MNYQIRCVGKLRERYFRDAANEYLKRIGRFGAIDEVEIPDLPEPQTPSPTADARVMAEEGTRLLRGIKAGDYVIALCIEGERWNSPAFAQYLAALEVRGVSHVSFMIGGSLGLSPDVLRRADCKLSFSPMTFPHQLARVLLLEQLYRACKLNAGERYHK
ncbi:MAG: 23S rRNA (pseudouridine(1915)-N(3))-methyltransferase RlmH [Clostridia bacterium]